MRTNTILAAIIFALGAAATVQAQTHKNSDDKVTQDEYTKCEKQKTR